MRNRLHRGAPALFAFALLLPAWSADNSVPGIPNFRQVNSHLFRGGQPSSQSWPALAKMGVRIVIDLRREDEHSTAQEAGVVGASGMKYVNVPMKGVVAPPNELVDRVLAFLNSENSVFVHCKRGADRTGAIIACYRIEHDRWDRKQALNEAKSLGMGWDQFGLKHFIMAFQPGPRRLALELSDVEER